MRRGCKTQDSMSIAFLTISTCTATQTRTQTPVQYLKKAYKFHFDDLLHCRWDLGKQSSHCYRCRTSSDRLRQLYDQLICHLRCRETCYQEDELWMVQSRQVQLLFSGVFREVFLVIRTPSPSVFFKMKKVTYYTLIFKRT